MKRKITALALAGILMFAAFGADNVFADEGSEADTASEDISAATDETADNITAISTDAAEIEAAEQNAGIVVQITEDVMNRFDSPESVAEAQEAVQAADPGTLFSDTAVSGIVPAGLGLISGATTKVNGMQFVAIPDGTYGYTVARAAVPSGWSVSGRAIWNMILSPQYPVYVSASAISPDGSAEMLYESPMAFIERDNCSIFGMPLPHQDWQVDPDYYTIMLKYKNASAYCDYLAANGSTVLGNIENLKFIRERPLSAAEASQLKAMNAQLKATLEPVYNYTSGLSLLWTEVTFAEREYSCTINGVEKMFVNTSLTYGYETEWSSGFSYPGDHMAYVNWEVPMHYWLICDADDYDEYSEYYMNFCSNTYLSDQMQSAIRRLSEEIFRIMMEARQGRDTSTTIYNTVDDILSDGDSYTTTEAFTDYIYDQNDYTTSSGDHVKVPTRYDYVYEDSNGNIYYSDSVSDEPAGSKRLYPN